MAPVAILEHTRPVQLQNGRTAITLLVTLAYKPAVEQVTGLTPQCHMPAKQGSTSLG
jgi:hypothetical protein